MSSFDRTRLPGYKPRQETTQNDVEFTLIAHVRGWCHNSAVCLLCKAEDRAYKAERKCLGCRIL